MSSRLPAYLTGLLSLCIVVLLYHAALDTVSTLSPQGCRMSWMSPSYLLQTGFNRTWTPLARRYSLWLYREVGWEGHEVCQCCVPCLCHTNHMVVTRCPRPLHTWERWIFAPSAFDRVLRDAPVLLQSLRDLARVPCEVSETSRLLFRRV